MAARESKRALAEAAALLETDAQAARLYLRDVQRLAGPRKFAEIVAAMRAVGGTDVQAVAAVVAGMAPQDEQGP